MIKGSRRCMISRFALAFVGVTGVYWALRWSEVLVPGAKEMSKSGPFYTFKVLDSAKRTIDMASVAKDKVTLVVNVASE